MNITELTLDEFLVTNNQISTESNKDAFSFGEPSFKDLIGGRIALLQEGFTLHHLSSDYGDVALLHNNELVGYYAGEVIAISASYQGRGLSVPMILEAVKMRPLPPKRNLSGAGKAALTAAWKVAHGLATNNWLQSETNSNQRTESDKSQQPLNINSFGGTVRA